MKKGLGEKRFYLFGIMFVFVVLFSCTEDKNTEQSQNLFGVWLNATDANPSGRYVEKLTMNQDSTFIYEKSSYGIYADQTTDDLSASMKYEGRLTVDGHDLNLVATKKVNLDNFNQLADTSCYSTIVFEDCKFVIVGNSLKLTYTIYPADAPEITTKSFYQLEL